MAFASDQTAFIFQKVNLRRCAKWTLLLVLPCLALSTLCHTKEVATYERARLVNWSVKNIQRSRYTVEPFGGVSFGDHVSYLVPLYHMTVDLEGVRYNLSYEIKYRWSYIPKLTEGDALQVRIVDKLRAMLIRMPDGKEFKAKIQDKRPL